MRWFKLALMAAVLAAGTGGWAMAQETLPMPPGPTLLPHPLLAAVLGLTDEQKAAWEASRADLENMMRPLLQQAWVLQQELMGLLSRRTPDPRVIGQYMIALHELRTQLRDAYRAAEEEFTTLLTPDQKVKFEAFKAAPPGPGVRNGVMFGPMGTR